MKWTLPTLGALGLLLAALPATAHHSAAAYDRTKTVTITGEVTEYHWVNPHVWVYMRVTMPDGKTQNWALESESVGQLVRNGWAKESFKPGDKISATVWPLKDGSFGGQLGKIKFTVDGKELEA